MARAYVLNVDGSETKLDDRPTLAEAQKAVGGYIEDVTNICRMLGRTGKTVYVDEEGRLKKYQLNDRATAYFGFPLVGNVLVLEGWKNLKI